MGLLEAGLGPCYEAGLAIQHMGVASLPSNPRFELAIEPPPTELHDMWEWKPPLVSEFGTVLDRIKGLAQAGVTSLMVACNFLSWWIVLLQRRDRLAWEYTG
jgi:hypothetical protein